MFMSQDMVWTPNPPPFAPEAELLRKKPSTTLTTNASPALDEALAESIPCIFIDPVTEETLLTSAHLDLFLQQDLSLSRLDTAYDYLWWAGRQFPARPLHRQVYELSRTIAPTYRPDLHLVWCPRTSRLFVKPLPGYLLCHPFWASHVGIDQNLDSYARGLLLSYIWLVRTEKDWALAHDVGLLPAHITWADWRRFVEVLVRSGGLSVNALVGVHRRYHYGELRVNRLDHIYRFLSPLDGWQLVRGYGGLHHSSYSDFFQKRFRWIVVVFAFSTTVLSALQVALTTNFLGRSTTLQNISSSIAVLSLVALAAILLLVVVLYSWLFIFCFIKTLRNTAIREQKRRVWANGNIGSDILNVTCHRG